MDSSDWRRDVGNVAAELQSALLGSDKVEEFLADVARAAAGLIEGALACGVTVQATPRSRMLGATSDRFAARMDAVQYDVDDGPCLSALRASTVVAVDDIATDTRWPEFSRRGRLEGAAASLSVPLLVTGRAVGALNLYARQIGAIGRTDQDRARRFADQAAGAVALAARLAESEETARNLATALRSRSTIDQAMGALMTHAHISADEAFDLLRLRSQHTNTKLRDVANAVLTEITGIRPSGADDD
ncbi:GAF and ANTAR domain-containing protein [Pseudonocardia sp.]|uniref:GAF and ANTAR domain-containing protein n=1 Tax=Pseudonocardia sp. TaxID=60912 RepID=UPI002603AD39|nr:GAF and ANTAR domain-containing protein [Pseudonocardia sp.]MCW2719224.1 hypothetical protein [Pseudonocardia sp.]